VPIVSAANEEAGLQIADIDGAARHVVGLIQGALVLAKAFNDPGYLESAADLAIGALRGFGQLATADT
jgi:hypothetical protein